MSVGPAHAAVDLAQAQTSADRYGYSYQTAGFRTTSLPEQRYLEARAARLIDGA
jgi:hypothetical protein